MQRGAMREDKVIDLGKFDGVLVVSDFDDTLYGRGPEVSRENWAAIDRFTREGGRFTVATGRARPTFAAYAQCVPINAPVILSNGSALYDFSAGKMVYETYLPIRARDDLRQVAAAIPAVGFEAYHGDDIYAYNPNEVTRRHLERAHASAREVPILEMPLPWSKVILQQERAVLEQVQRYITDRWSGLYEAIFSSAVLLELTRKGSNKGGMVRYLAALLDIRPEHVYCIGDNQNDIPMLEVSAIPFAPANCAKEVRAWGPRLVRSCEENGVAEMFEILDGLY